MLANPPKAAPIAANPLLISSQLMAPNFCNAVAKSSKLCTATNIVAAPSKPAPPHKVPISPEISPSSPRASPIPAKPFAVSSHVIDPNFLKASAKSSKL